MLVAPTIGREVVTLVGPGLVDHRDGAPAMDAVVLAGTGAGIPVDHGDDVPTTGRETGPGVGTPVCHGEDTPTRDAVALAGRGVGGPGGPVGPVAHEM